MKAKLKPGLGHGAKEEQCHRVTGAGPELEPKAKTRFLIP